MNDVILVGTDGSEVSTRAALHALSRVKDSATRLHVVYVYEWSRYEILSLEQIEARHKEHKVEIDRAQSGVLDPLVADLKSRGGDVEVTSEVCHGHAPEILCQKADELGASQIYIGRRGRSSMERLLFGSVASSLVQTSPVPVTVVP
ncbi:MAG: universal stress protein [Rhodospirillaceae bacterium]|jgi:nucleotide-binding universal stress UspA family protein|nr:universal stress protein [Rhodospirillaceae bacterium]MBT7488092.1 universal stress protein [Rhodospirillales bacterium]MBT4700309.1 universal stress protein [Rhodospirillaceae bacterium]MBT5036154.1 universal stress protein [Rhodospirillaceae bacterium]MBT6218641.1 universal stress protein [Rhodospirillaceae bacterium]